MDCPHGFHPEHFAHGPHCPFPHWFPGSHGPHFHPPWPHGLHGPHWPHGLHGPHRPHHAGPHGPQSPHHSELHDPHQNLPFQNENTYQYGQAKKDEFNPQNEGNYAEGEYGYYNNGDEQYRR